MEEFPVSFNISESHSKQAQLFDFEKIVEKLEKEQNQQFSLKSSRIIRFKAYEPKKLLTMNSRIQTTKNFINYFSIVNVESGEEVFDYSVVWGDTAKVRDICFSPDGQFLYMFTSLDVRKYEIKGNDVSLVRKKELGFSDDQVIESCEVGDSSVAGMLKVFEANALLSEAELLTFDLQNLNLLQRVKHQDCLISVTNNLYLDHPIAYNITSDTLLTSSKDGHICEWTANLTILEQVDLKAVQQILPNGRSSLINLPRVVIENIYLEKDKLFVLDQHHEIINIFEKQNGKLVQKSFGIEFVVEEDMSSHLGMFDLHFGVYGFYSTAHHSFQIFQSELENKDQKKVTQITVQDTNNPEYVFAIPSIQEVITIDETGLANFYAYHIICSEDSQWSQSLGHCISSPKPLPPKPVPTDEQIPAFEVVDCEKISYTKEQKSARSCECIENFSFNPETLRCDIQCITETKNVWKDGKPFCNCPTDMQWHSQFLICESKTPTDPNTIKVDDEGEGIAPWGVFLIVILSILLVTLGGFCLVKHVINKRKQNNHDYAESSDKDSDRPSKFSQGAQLPVKNEISK